MNRESVNVNSRYYNLFSICQDFRQRLEELQRLRRQEKKIKDVRKKK